MRMKTSQKEAWHAVGGAGWYMSTIYHESAADSAARDLVMPSSCVAALFLIHL
jgi:hypothetical protein